MQPQARAFARLPDRLLRWPEVNAMTGLSRTEAWRRERDGKFPRRLKIGPQQVGWRQSEVMAWLESLERV